MSLIFFLGRIPSLRPIVLRLLVLPPINIPLLLTGGNRRSCLEVICDGPMSLADIEICLFNLLKLEAEYLANGSIVDVDVTTVF